MKHLSRRERWEKQRASLASERTSFEAHWKDLADHIAPRRLRLSVTDNNKGDKRNQKIIDSTAVFAARTLRAGMMSGITSPARPWFKLSTPDPAIAEYGPVKEWLHTVTDRMQTVFLRSNFYNVLPYVYLDTGVFATACMSIVEDFENTIHCYSFPVGSFWIANNAKLRTQVFRREYQMTVEQLVDQFKNPDDNKDWSNFSTQIKDAYERGDYQMKVDVCHVIERNDLYDPTSISAKRGKLYTSAYYERGTYSTSGQLSPTDSTDRCLSEKGFDHFPILSPRWEVTGEDVYGTNCPGMEALGDIKQLQVGEKRSAQAIEKMVNPPMIGPTNMRTVAANILPGGVTYLDEREGTKGFRPAHEVSLNIQQLEMKQGQVRERVLKAFYADLFLMMSNSDRRQITATEIDERREEKLLALGPVYEQLNVDLLNPAIDTTFSIMLKQGKIPPPPEEIQGSQLKVEYISIMAQAQKMLGIGSLERFGGFIGGLAKIMPEAMDCVKVVEYVNTYGDQLSLPPNILRDQDEIDEIKASREKAAMIQQAQQGMLDGSQAIKNLSQSNTGGANALQQIIDQGQAGQLVPPA